MKLSLALKTVKVISQKDCSVSIHPRIKHKVKV